MAKRKTEADKVHNDALAHVILLEAALIEFRGFYLRKDYDGMFHALETFMDRANAFGDSLNAVIGDMAEKKEQAS